MLSVSDRYKSKVYTQDSARYFKGEVLFELLDITAYDDASISFPLAGTESPISRSHQLIDRSGNITNKYASFEPDYFKLDGTFKLPPKPNQGNVKVGYVSNELSTDTSTHTFNEVVLEVIFEEPHSSAGMTITFDTANNEYATQMIIVFMNESGAPVHVEFETNNRDVTYVIDKNLDNYKSIQIVIVAWSKPNRRAKISAIDFGIFESFTDEDLINMTVIEEINVVGDTLPSNELRFVVDNSDRRYNILNPVGQYRFLMERQKLQAALYLEVSPNEFEHINMGSFYLREWKSDEGALTTTFTAYSYADLLEDVMYEGYGPTNMYDLVIDILDTAKIEKYEIDEKLKHIPTNGFYEIINCRKALYYVGMASKSIVNQDRDGVVRIQQFRTLDAGEKYIRYAGAGMYAGDLAYPEVNQGFDMKNITFKNVYNEPQIKLDQQVETVIMVVESFDTGVKTFYELKNHDVHNGVTVMHENPLIVTEDLALDIATWIMKERSLRALYEVTWRQNPALECGDQVLIEDSYGAKKLSRIIKQQFDYAGTLSGRTETRGGV